MSRNSIFGLLLLALFTFTAHFSKGSDNAWRDRTVRVGDIKIHYLESGSGEDYLVFIPGWTMVAEVWKEQIPYFAARGYHVIAFDPRGHGKTSGTEDGNTYSQHAADLHALLKVLKIQKASLIGWSAGVVVLLEYVSSPESLHPEKLVFVDGFPKGLRDEDYPSGMTMQQARSVILALQEDRAKFTDQFIRSMFKSKQYESLYTELSEGSMRTPIGVATALFADLFTGDRRTALLRIDDPTLIIVSEDNRLAAEYMQSQISASKLEVIPNGGHALFLEKSQTFNQIVEVFLNEP